MTKVTKKQPVSLWQILELVVHLFLIVGVPVIYLEITTGFNKYRMPTYMNTVYIYWLLYIAIVPLFYKLLKGKK